MTCDTLAGPPPAAPDDGFAAVQWITANADKLGGIPGKLAVAGWSAGANVAAVVCQTARNAGGPEIVGQMLLCPVTDCDFDRQSYIDNGDGYILTAELMKWFWDHYADPADRTNPKASPLLANDLSNLPRLGGHLRIRPAQRRRHGLRRGDEGGGHLRHAPCSSRASSHVFDGCRHGEFGCSRT